MRNSTSLALLLALMLLLHEPVAALNWQGTGEVSDEKLAFIWDYIQQKLKTATTIGQLKLINDGLSDALNTAYDPAWNTVTSTYNSARNPTYNDLILYGYAFRNQWMWLNGYKIPNFPYNSFSFVVWKDYNCQTWKTLGEEAAAVDQLTGFNTQQKAVISQWITSLQANQLLNDPWGAAKSLIDTIQGSTNFVVNNDRAYSVIMHSLGLSQAFVAARLCVVGQEFYDSSRDYPSNNLATSEGRNYGRFIMFRTR